MDEFYFHRRCYDTFYLYTLHSQNDILKNIEEIKNSGRLLNPIAWQNKNSQKY